LTPTSPITAPLLSEIEKTHPEQIYLQDILTVSSNLAGLPSISIPTTKKAQEGKLSIGIQVIAPFQKDIDLLSRSQFIHELLK